MRRLSLMLAVLLITSAVSAQPKPLRFVTQDFPPFSYIEEGQVAGPAAEIVRLTCARIQIECHFQLLPWRRALSDVKKGRAEGAFVLGWNQPRTQWLYFSEPILRTEYGFFVATDSPLKTFSKEALAGFRVAVYGPSNLSYSLEQLSYDVPDMHIVLRPDDTDGFRQLPLGRVQAVYSNRDVGWEMLKRLNIKNVRYVGPHRALSYYIGFGKNSVTEQQVDRFNQAYRSLLAEGEIDRILAPYAMTPQYD